MTSVRLALWEAAMRRAIDGYFSGSEHWGRWVRVAFYLDPELTERLMRAWAELSDGRVTFTTVGEV